MEEVDEGGIGGDAHALAGLGADALAEDADHVLAAGAAVGTSLRDMHNYLVTSPTIDGDWSDPVHVNSSGFDPSLFRDDDGRLYVLNMLWDHRSGHNRFSGVLLQEYSPAERRLVGQRKLIFKGTEIGFTEAPHIHKRNGYFYLLTAEGGTFFGHAATLARSRRIDGPYELHPDVYLLTARDRPDVELQRSGHADWVETEDGETYLVHLCGRPLRNRGRCTLGRETAIQKLRWSEDGWPRLATGGRVPAMTVEAPPWEPHPVQPPTARDDFDGPELPIDFQWLRSPFPEELFSLTERPGYLRLYGRETIGSLFRQALVARRQQAKCITVSTTVDFSPEHFQQMAGLVCYYNSTKYHYLLISRDEVHGRHLRVLSALPDQATADAVTAPVPIPETGRVRLRAEIDEERLLFAYAVDDGPWNWLPQIFDASILSDEAMAPGTANLTGNFVGMCRQDMAGTGRHADFDDFTYVEREYSVDPRGRDV